MTLRKEGRSIQTPNPPLVANGTTEKELGGNTIVRTLFPYHVV